MTKRKTLTVQLMELQAQYEALKAAFVEVCDRRDELESQLINAENYIARIEGPRAQRPVQGQLVREFINADGVRMGKYAIGHNRFAIRPITA